MEPVSSLRWLSVPLVQAMARCPSAWPTWLASDQHPILLPSLEAGKGGTQFTLATVGCEPPIGSLEDRDQRSLKTQVWGTGQGLGWS